MKDTFLVVSNTLLTPQPFEPPPDVPFHPVLDLGGEEESNTNPIQENNAPLQVPPEIAPAPQEPPPDAPATPPAKPIKLEPATPVSNHSPSPEASPTIPLAIQHTRRVIWPPAEWWKIRNPTPSVLSDSDDSDDESDGDSAEFAGAAHDSDPRSLKATLQCSDGNKWQEAAKLEMDNHISNGTWELVDLPPDAKCINSGWVFRVK